MTDDNKTIRGKPNLRWEMDAGSKQPIKRGKPDGEWIVTYSFTESPPEKLDADITNLRPLDPIHCQAAVQSMQDIETVALLRFVEKPEGEADIVFCKGTFTSESVGRMIDVCDTRYIAVHDRDHVALKGLFTHEILHALGFSHPDGPSGFNPRYDENDTVMSYNSGKSFKDGLTENDISELWEVYGRRLPAAGSETVRGADLVSDTDIVYAGAPVTLDVRDLKLQGALILDADRDVKGWLAENPSEFPTLHTRVIGEQKIKNLLVDPEARIRIDAVGNDLRNRLQGGGKDDRLTARGGGDILSGGSGHDTFIFDGKSGLDNIVTDFEADDGIVLKLPGAKVELREHPGSGTELVVSDAVKNHLASVFIDNVTPAQLKNRVWNENGKYAELTEVTAPSFPGDTPPVPGSPSSKRRR